MNKIKPFISLLSILLFLNINKGQESDYIKYVKQNAIKLESANKLNQNVYSLISKYQILMIGEMHGTNEPASFVSGLIQLLTNNNDSIQIGIEIPSYKMQAFLSNPNSKTIYRSLFFQEKSKDGRATTTWANIIKQYYKHPKVRFFFYDLDENQSKTEDDRDSLMYLNIKKQILLKPNWKTITLSGNIHNMLLPRKEKVKMGLYLMKDKELNLDGKTLSLTHCYTKGTMLNNSGTGLTVHKVNLSDSPLAKVLTYDCYLLIYPEGTIAPYSGFFYTKTVTAAKLTNRKQ
ncbi:MAG: hypothetical protein QM534_08680 [Sediminibacterium sp.]|nr:hypothetical protein [Sediminibacterium sp.]